MKAIAYASLIFGSLLLGGCSARMEFSTEVSREKETETTKILLALAAESCRANELKGADFTSCFVEKTDTIIKQIEQIDSQ